MRELVTFLLVEGAIFTLFMIEEVLMDEWKGVTLWDVICKFMNKNK